LAPTWIVCLAAAGWPTEAGIVMAAPAAGSADVIDADTDLARRASWSIPAPADGEQRMQAWIASRSAEPAAACPARPALRADS